MKTKTIKISRTILASVLFVVLTAVKLLLPGQTEELRTSVCEAISRDYDYEQALEDLGRRISDSALIQALGGQESAETETDDYTLPVAEYRPVTINDLRGEMTSILPKNTEHADYSESETASESDTASEIDTTADDSVQEVVAAFLETQAEYTEYEVPADVTYDMPKLPFEYASPVTGYTSSGFGFRLHPIADEVKFHYGTDFAAWSGTDIYSFADGTVSMVGYDVGYGNYIIIDHGSGWESQYAHCSTVYITIGQSVSMGDKIALVGDTGEVTGPHLHFELKCDGVYYNPEFYLA